MSMFKNLLAFNIALQTEFVVTLFLYLGVLLLTTKIFGIICRKLGLPQVVGALLAGMLLGPITGFIKVGANAEIDIVFKALSQIGVLMIMFSSGLDTNIKEIKKNGLPSIVITVLGVVVPLVFGFFVGWGIDRKFAAFNSQSEVMHCLFFGIMLTATSVGITVEVLKELGKLKGKVGSSILSAAILDDIIGILILSVVISINGSGDGNVTITETVIRVLLFFVFAVGAGVLCHYIIKWLSKKFPVSRRIPIFGLVICLIFAWASEALFGVAAITGAFVAGVVMSNMPSTEYIEKKIDTNSYMFFGPIFFANIGIGMDFSTFNVELLGFSVAFVVFGLLAKILGCGAGALMCKYSFKDSVRVGFGMMARGEVVLIVANKGINAGIIDAKYMFPVVLLIIISSFLTPICLKLLYKKDDATPLELDGIEPPPYEEETAWFE